MARTLDRFCVFALLAAASWFAWYFISEASPPLAGVARQAVSTEPVVPALPFDAITKPLSDHAFGYSKWKYVVMHHSGADTCTVESITRWHVEGLGWRAMGYHFIVLADGTVHVGERWANQWDGAHCKGARNKDGIGVCLIGNFEDHAPTRAQVLATAALVAFLRSELRIPSDSVIEHRACAATLCPGLHFPLTAFRDSAEKASDCN